MLFKELTAVFGRLENETLALQPGLNIIEAPNESGKSSWAAFLRVMLYGMNTRDRSPLADKRRYLPWNGAAPEGRMVLSCTAGDLTVLRRTAHPTSPMGQFSALYADTSQPVPGLTTANCGEVLTGVPQAVYERSAFIRQSGIAIDQDAALERRIAALITTGEEDTSYSDASHRLKQQLNRRSRSHTGLLPQIEQQIAEAERTCAWQCRLQSDLAGCKAQLEELTRQREQLRLQLRLHREADRAQLLYRAQEAEYRAQLSQSGAAERRARQALEAHPFYPRTPEEAGEIPPETSPRPKPGILFPCLCALAGAALMGAVIYFAENLLTALGSGLGLMGLLLIIGAALLRKRQQTWDQARSAQLREHSEALAAYTILYKEAQRCRQEVRGTSAPQPPTLPVLSRPQTSPDALEQALRQLETRLEDTQRQLAALSHQLQAAGDPLVLEEQLQQLRAQKEQLQKECAALSLASQVLEKANAALQQRFSPELGERSAKIFTKLTREKYNKVLLDRSMTPSAQETEQFLPRAAAELSQGAADQLYLAVRLAICQTVLPQDDPPPIVLDDALVTFDDERCAAALDYLLELSEKQQILLFTCQKREAAYLRQHAAHPFHVINL